MQHHSYVRTLSNVAVSQPEKLNVRVPQAKSKENETRDDDEYNAVSAAGCEGLGFGVWGLEFTV